MQKLPQRLVNVRVTDRDATMAAPAVAEATARETEALAGRGRVLLRPSGTEPLVRVMVEAPSAEEADAVCERLVAVVSRRGVGRGHAVPSARHVRDRGIRRPPPGPGDPPAGPAQPRVPRLRLGRHLGASPTARSSRCARSGNLSAPGRRRSHGDGGVAVATRPATTGHRPHALGDARPRSEENAHPHFDTRDRVHVVVNGIVENYVALQGAPDRRGRGVHVRDRRRGDRPPDRHHLRRRSARGRAPAYAELRATSRSWRCRWTIPTCWSARARSAR